jgi:hypothetical protein
MPEGQRELRRPKQRRHDNSKVSLKETGCEYFLFEFIDGDSNSSEQWAKSYHTTRLILYCSILLHFSLSVD